MPPNEITFTTIKMVLMGAILTDIVMHPEGFGYAAFQLALYTEGRCSRCGYRMERESHTRYCGVVYYVGDLAIAYVNRLALTQTKRKAGRLAK
jgi:hypothetical protein